MIIPYQFIQKDMDKSISHYFWLGRDGAQDIVVYFMIVWSLQVSEEKWVLVSILSSESQKGSYDFLYS